MMAGPPLAVPPSPCLLPPEGIKGGPPPGGVRSCSEEATGRGHLRRSRPRTGSPVRLRLGSNSETPSRAQQRRPTVARWACSGRSLPVILATEKQGKKIEEMGSPRISERHGTQPSTLAAGPLRTSTSSFSRRSIVFTPTPRHTAMSPRRQKPLHGHRVHATADKNELKRRAGRGGRRRHRPSRLS